ncbi:type II toxin-antitoxin system RelE/ParE family toxin, partial [Candidatus Roizmanbacteria bacterium]|nr:type II toxin-antitoxin system RelE/ParE family toxin [Candidatus Roizmanbacteria bacterium]
MWQIRFEKRAKKDLDKIPEQYQKRIFSVLLILQTNPYLGKKLEGKLNDFYVYRVWPYRIIYKIYK